MNQAAKNALRKAWIEGVKQIKHYLRDNAGGYCAQGVIIRAGVNIYLLLRPMDGCPVCCGQEGTVGDTQQFLTNELAVVAHLNNDNEFDFAKIAEIMPDTP